MQLADYQDRFASIYFERSDDGVLLVRFHSDGGPFRFGSASGAAHSQLGEAFHCIAQDAVNRVVILTGTGDVFCDSFESGMGTPSPAEFDRLYKEGRDLLTHLLAIEVPVIGAVNGPATIHAEIVAMSDVVLAAEHACFADHAHFRHGVVPGDGVNLFWPSVLGANRGRSFLLTGEVIDAAEARRIGLVAEVLPADRLMARAFELARDWAAKPRLALRYTRQLLIAPLRKAMAESLGESLALELAAVAARPMDD